MSEPEPLRTSAHSIEALLLDSAADDAPPPELLGRTLAKVGLAGPSATAASTALGSGAAPAASSGLLTAVGIGTLAGLVTVGIAHMVLPSPAPPRPSYTAVLHPQEAAPEAPASPSTAPVPGSAETKITSAPATPPSSAPPARRPGVSSLGAELALIDAARGAVASGDRARALTLLDRYAREFPSGQLAPEASRLRADAVKMKEEPEVPIP